MLCPSELDCATSISFLTSWYLVASSTLQAQSHGILHCSVVMKLHHQPVKFMALDDWILREGWNWVFLTLDHAKV